MGNEIPDISRPDHLENNITGGRIGNRRPTHDRRALDQISLLDGGDECVDVADLMQLLVRLEGVEDHMDDGDARKRVTEIRADLAKMMLNEVI